MIETSDSVEPSLQAHDLTCSEVISHISARVSHTCPAFWGTQWLRCSKEDYKTIPISKPGNPLASCLPQKSAVSCNSQDKLVLEILWENKTVLA